MAETTGSDKEAGTTGKNETTYAGVSGKKATDSGYRIKKVSDYKPVAPGYQKIAFLPFLVGAVVVGLPIPALAKEKADWVNAYIFLIVLSLVIFWFPGVSRFSDFVKAQQAKIKG